MLTRLQCMYRCIGRLTAGLIRFDRCARRSTAGLRITSLAAFQHRVAIGKIGNGDGRERESEKSESQMNHNRKKSSEGSLDYCGSLRVLESLEGVSVADLP